jgi:predicted adenylyl cyclase CyaB
LQNIEVKLALPDRTKTLELLQNWLQIAPSVFAQHDVFFNTNQGFLKLRHFADGNGELISYLRQGMGKAMHSEYYIYKTNEPKTLQTVLQNSYGVKGEVKKTRTLYLYEHTRIHVDEVAGLGNFLELEVVMQPNQSNAEGEAITKTILQKLQLDKEPLIKVPYLTLIMQKLG